jgi:tRNA-specific 2-thiouridylase
MLRKAGALGCEYISTGHYVDLREENGRMVISRSKDHTKDQSYALWAVREEHFRRTLFPLSGLTKDEIRAIARDNNLPVAGKRESYEICFVSDNNYRRFLKENIPNIDLKAPKGTFMYHDQIVGEHDGVPFYTIGQRKGLGISLPTHPEPLYVTGLDVINNVVELGDDEELLTKQLTAHSVNMIKYAELPKEGIRVTAKIRYKDEGASAMAYQISDSEIRIEFDTDRRAITPGQSVVLYESDDVIGGGIIQ